MSDIAEALKPFAEEAEKFNHVAPEGDNWPLIHTTSLSPTLTIGHLRRAREALASQPPDEAEPVCDCQCPEPTSGAAGISETCPFHNHPHEAAKNQRDLGPAQPPPAERELIEALKAYKQADEDGVMVLVSRQACDEAAALLQDIADHFLFNRTIPPGMIRTLSSRSPEGRETVIEACARVAEAEGEGCGDDYELACNRAAVAIRALKAAPTETEK